MWQNSWLPTLRAAIAALLVGATAAAAQDRIAVAGWEGFVISSSDGQFERCVLYNRTINALNDSPYDMLGLSQNGAGEVRMLVFYRPRALKRALDVPVTIRLDRKAPVTVKGDVLSDFHVRLKGPLDAKTIAALRRVKTLAVLTQGVTEKFALAHVDAVLDALAACVKSKAP